MKDEKKNKQLLFEELIQIGGDYFQESKKHLGLRTRISLNIRLNKLERDVTRYCANTQAETDNEGKSPEEEKSPIEISSANNSKTSSSTWTAKNILFAVVTGVLAGLVLMLVQSFF